MKTVVSSKGQIVLPIEYRRLDRILPGQEFKVERIERGEYIFKRQPTGDNEGMVNWLLDCPERGWFQAIESESTTTL